jgi:hypothetical protein
MLSLNCKHVLHVKIYLPCNFEVNFITYFGVIALFSSNLFDEKREIAPKWVTGFTSKLHGRQILTC